MFILIAVAGVLPGQAPPDVAAGIVGGDCILYVLILPVDRRGDFRCGRERLGNGRMASDLAALRARNSGRPRCWPRFQPAWPWACCCRPPCSWPGHHCSTSPARSISLPPALEILCWVLGQLLVTSVAVYAASFSKNTLRAILAAFVILVAGGWGLIPGGNWVHHNRPAPIPWMGRPATWRMADTAASIRGPGLHAVPVPMVCLVQFPALRPSARTGGRPARRDVPLRLG